MTASPDQSDARQGRLQERGSLPRSGMPTIAADDLLRGAKEILITHDNQTYRLRLTRNGKLVLTK